MTDEFILRPHRSLSAHGFAIVMVVIGAATIAAGLLFWWLGAWPVLGFLGLDVVLVWLAFRASYAGARHHERLRLDDHALVVERVDRHGAITRQTLPMTWLRVDHETPAHQPSRLIVAANSQRLEIGAFLAAPERANLALALRAAIAAQRDRAATPGKVLPSSHSRNAPPAVET